jgi:hypothetical protein
LALICPITSRGKDYPFECNLPAGLKIQGFVLSDHADFQELETSCLATEAHTISVTHGYSAVFARYLAEKHGLETKVLKSAWERME